MANNTNRTTRIKHVFGNVLKLAIPLTLRTVTLEGGLVVTNDTNYTPSNHHPVVVQFVNGPLKYELDATIRDNYIAVVEDKGTIPVGTYAIVVLCRDDNGDPRRFKQRCVLEVVDVTADAGIEVGIEFEAQEWLLDGAIFLAVKGEDGDDGVGIESITTDETSISGEYNQVTFHLTNGTSYTLNVRNGESTEQTLPANVVVDNDYTHTDNNYTDVDKQRVANFDKLFGDVSYDRISRRLNFFKHGDTMHTSPLKSIDITDFVRDSRVSSFRIIDGNLTIKLNSDGNNEEFKVPISSIANLTNYYDKSQTDDLLSGKANKSEVYNKTYIDGQFYLASRRVVTITETVEWDEVSYSADMSGAQIYSNHTAGRTVIAKLGDSIGQLVYCDDGNAVFLFGNLADEVFLMMCNDNLWWSVEITSGGGGSVEQAQADWAQTDTSAVDFIKNKPTIPTKVSDLTNDSGFTSNAGTVTGITMNGASKGTSGVVDLGTVITAHQDISGKANASDVYTKTQTDTLLASKQDTLTFDTTPTANSTKPVTSGGIKTYVDGKATITGITTSQDGTFTISLSDGNSYTVNLNHVHPQYTAKKTVESNTDATVTLSADVIYNLGTVAGNKTINLPTTVDQAADYEFRLSYTSGTISGTAISGTTVANNATLTFTAGKTYQVIISGGILYFSETTVSA